MQAVITSDIINYSRLEKKEEDLVLESLQLLFEQEKLRSNIGSKGFRISRGDSIQAELEVPEQSLKLALLLKSSINKIRVKESNTLKPSIDLRIAIGIGSISSRRENVDESTGDAYSFSGRTLDTLKKRKRLIDIKTLDDNINAELQTEFVLLEEIISQWSVYSAEVVYWTLMAFTEEEIGRKLSISQSAVNQRKKRSGWNAIEVLLNRFELLINTVQS